jgi:hypothetical protein
MFMIDFALYIGIPGNVSLVPRSNHLPVINIKLPQKVSFLKAWKQSASLAFHQNDIEMGDCMWLTI